MRQMVNQKGFAHILLLLLLLIGLGVAVYLTQFTQIFKSKASSSINDGIEFTDDNGDVIYCSPDSSGVYLCYSDTKKVNIKVKNLDPLTQ